MSQIRESLAVDLSIRRMFEAATIAELALVIRDGQAGEPDESIKAPPILPVPHDQELPLSFAQQRMWFLYQIEPQSSA
jgi:hypothetical protein